MISDMLKWQTQSKLSDGPKKSETKPRWPLSRWLESSCCGSVSWSSSPSDQEAGHPAVELGRRGIRFRPMTRPRPRTRFKKRF